MVTRRFCCSASIGADLEEALAIALRHQVFGRDVVDLRQQRGDRFGPFVGQDEVRFVAADRIRMTFDEEGFARILLDHLQHGVGNLAQGFRLRHRHFGAAGRKGDRIEIDAADLVADTSRVPHLVDRIDALDLFHRRLGQEVIVIAVRLARRIDDVFTNRHAQAHRRQLVADIVDRRTGAFIDLRRIDHQIFSSVPIDTRCAARCHRNDCRS